LAKGFRDLGVAEDRAYDLADQAVEAIEARALDLVKGMATSTRRDSSTGVLTVGFQLAGEIAVGP
jgi:hypothetical protein